MQKELSSSGDTLAQLEDGPAIRVGFCLEMTPPPVSDSLALSFQVEEGMLEMEACLVLLQGTKRKEDRKPGKAGTANTKESTWPVTISISSPAVP